jgi:1,4-dihydroxy-2-naphthoate polyprenyltransferase
MAERFICYISVLVRMARPPQLLAITLVYVLGCLLALAFGFDISTKFFVAGILALIPISISIHYANEYADFETDRLTVRTPFSGGSGALLETGLPRRTALTAAWVALIIGSVTALTGWVTNLLPSTSISLLAVGVFFGWMYSLRPLALAWNGWGELTNAVLGGILLPLYGFSIHTGQVNSNAIFAFIPLGMLVFNNLLATTWADRWADAWVGKCTLATRIPANKLRLLYVIVAFGAVLALFCLRDVVFPPFVFRSSLLVIPLLIWGAWSYTRQHSPFPSVAVMVFFLLVQMAAWWIIIQG